MTKTKELVLTYFQAWEMRDWEKMRSCLSSNFKIDGGQIQFKSIEDFIAFCKSGPSWSKITLLDVLFLDTKAALLYEGMTPTGEKIRVGEFLTIDQNKIIHSKMALSLG